MNANTLDERDIFERDVSARVDTVSDIRHQIEAWLAGRGIASECVEDLALAFSELLTNAFEADPTGTVQVRAVLDSDAVELDVSNETYTALSNLAPGAPDGMRGRGLLVVRACTDELELIRTEQRVLVRARRQFGPHTPYSLGR